MEIPLGLETETPKEAVCKLNKSLYGLKQSLRAWFDRFTQAMKNFGYHQCRLDHTLFVQSTSAGKSTIHIVYDDIVVTSDDKKWYEI